MTTATQGSSHVFKRIQHVGKRPKGDRDNSTRERLCCLLKDSGKLFELVPERLYVIHLTEHLIASEFCSSTFTENSSFICWNCSADTDLYYDSFCRDFGPFNLAITHQICSQLKVWVDTYNYRGSDRCILIVLEDKNPKKKYNVTLAVAIASMILFNLKDEEVIQRLKFNMVYKRNLGESFKELTFKEMENFVDVSGVMALGFDDCIKAFYAALQLNFYNYYDFDHAAYLYYEMPANGDLNWIIPGKILAFAGPTKFTNTRCDPKIPPSFYHQYFNEHNVTTVVRLNEPEYESSEFTDYGFDHYDLIFPDGSPPTLAIAQAFIDIVDESKGVVAVHCFAGIGRTGTLIAAYLVARYNFTPQMAMAWTRICRPGSVIGEQQDWLVLRFNAVNSPTKQVKISETEKSVKGDQSSTGANSKVELSYETAEKMYGQAKALLMEKRQRNKAERRTTRSVTVNKSSIEDAGSNDTGHSASKVDLVLDLGQTVPLDLLMREWVPLQGKKNPKFYHMVDGKYEWKVKFPQSRVQLKHLLKQDIVFLKISGENTRIAHGRPMICHNEMSNPINTSDAQTTRLPVIHFNIRTALLKQMMYIFKPEDKEESD